MPLNRPPTGKGILGQVGWDPVREQDERLKVQRQSDAEMLLMLGVALFVAILTEIFCG